MVPLLEYISYFQFLKSLNHFHFENKFVGLKLQICLFWMKMTCLKVAAAVTRIPESWVKLIFWDARYVCHIRKSTTMQIFATKTTNNLKLIVTIHISLLLLLLLLVKLKLLIRILKLNFTDICKTKTLFVE